ncbi:universal stress protein [Paracoccus pacificus]|uniref:Universal stress protein n=1 Tax=Paracoccus pacificus TaxID=1463598 RepID=A0ABW4R9T5_9RHOB
MFQKILLAYDGSVGSDRALEKATELALLTGGELAVLTVYRHHAMLEASISMVRGKLDPGGNLDETMKTTARETADHAKTRAKAAGVRKVTASIKAGPPARTIVSVAREKGVDLIVVGSRGLGSAEGFLLGSVSHKVTGLADCPVLVV